MTCTIILPSQLLSFAPDIAVLGLDSPELSQIYAQSLTLRGKPGRSQTWSQKLRKEGWTRRLSSRTLSPSHTTRFVDAWTSQLRESHASRTAMKESDRGGVTNDSCLTTSSPDWQSCSQTWCSSKMSKGYSPAKCQTELFALDTFSDDWRTSDTVLSSALANCRSDYFQRLKSVLHTSGTESSYWPTPKARDWKDTLGSSLDSKNPDGSHRDRRDRIVGVLAALLTDGQPDQTNHSTDGKNLELCHKMKERLNPRWVAQLMGVPTDWVYPSEQERNRTDELRMLGNGVVPQTAAKAFTTLLNSILQ